MTWPVILTSDFMNRAIKAAALAAALLLTMQSVFAEESCARGPGSGNSCAAACCIHMSDAPASQMVAGCKTSLLRSPSESTCGQQGCSISSPQATLQFFSPPDYATGHAPLTSEINPLFAQLAQAPTSPPYVDDARSEPDRYLLLHVFRI